MGCEFCEGGLRWEAAWRHARAPNEQFIVIAPRCQLTVIETPLHPTYFLLVSLKFGKIVAIFPQISIENVPIATARTHKGISPCYRAYSSVVPAQRPRHFSLLCIPNLQIARLSSNSESWAIARPLHTSYSIIRPNVAQLCHFAIWGVPHVYAGAKSDSEGVLGRPIHQIEIEIVLQKWSI